MEEQEHTDHTKKVPYCVGCITADFVPQTVNENGREKKVCPYCGDFLIKKSLAKIAEAERRRKNRGWNAMLASQTPDVVTRYIDSPWGKLTIQVSTHSFFAPAVRHVKKGIVKSIESLEWKETKRWVNLPAIKRMIDEEFSEESVQAAAEVMPGGRNIEFVSFWRKLESVIEQIHNDPNPKKMADLNPEVEATVPAIPLPVAKTVSMYGKPMTTEQLRNANGWNTYTTEDLDAAADLIAEQDRVDRAGLLLQFGVVEK